MATVPIRSSQDSAASVELESIAQRKQNPNYMARIVYQLAEAGESTSSDSGVITLYLPENFQLNFSSSFDQPFAQGLVNAPGLNQAMKFFGASLTSQSMSVQVWQGTACPEFNMTFQLIAETDPVQDILNPIKKLSKLVVPGVNAAGLLTPPGPRISLKATAEALGAAASGVLQGASGAIAGLVTQDYAQQVGALQNAGTAVSSSLRGILANPENNVTLHIGRFLRLPSVVIQSVSQTYDTIFDSSGLPLKANIDVTFSTWYVPVKTDIDDIFQGR